MEAIKSFTSLEQSKKLAEILPPESADMCYLPTHIGDEHHFIASLSPYSVCTKMTDVSIEYCTPCWSLAALLGVLPSSIKDSIGMVYSLNMDKEYIEYSNPTISSLCSVYIHTCGNDNLIDACYEMIIRLNELNLL